MTHAEPVSPDADSGGNARFLNRDPIDYAGGINLYAYAGNNPVTGSDPSGLDDSDSDSLAHIDAYFDSKTPADWEGWAQNNDVTITALQSRYQRRFIRFFGRHAAGPAYSLP